MFLTHGNEYLDPCIEKKIVLVARFDLNLGSLNSKHSVMSEEKNEIPREQMVDQFIALANELSKTQTKEKVGAAIMFAASRYNAFEASSKSDNLINDKSDALVWYSREYMRMFEANIDELIEMRGV